MNSSTAANRLRRLADDAEPNNGYVALSIDDARKIAELLMPANGDSPVTHAEIVKNRQFIAAQGDQLLAMGAAMRLMRVYVLTAIEFEESGEVAQYLAAWIDNGKWLPHKWPEQWPAVCRFLLEIGFCPRNGLIGLPDEQIGDRAQAEAERKG